MSSEERICVKPPMPVPNCSTLLYISVHAEAAEPMFCACSLRYCLSSLIFLAWEMYSSEPMTMRFCSFTSLFISERICLTEASTSLPLM